MLAAASIGPCKWFAAFGITSKVSPRRGESTHLRPKSRLTAVGLRNAPAGANAGPGNCFGFCMWNHPSVTCGDGSRPKRSRGCRYEGGERMSDTKAAIAQTRKAVKPDKPKHVLRTLGHSIREYKKASVLAPLFVAVEGILETLIPTIMKASPAAACRPPSNSA